MSEESASSDSSEENETNLAGLTEDDESKLRETIFSLRAHLKNFPTSYDTHVELIHSLRVVGDLDELRLARETMNAIYPLAPNLWLEWIEDERKIAVTDDEKRKVECLFKRAIDDYDDVSIWTEYCLFAIGNLQPGNTDSVQATEAIFDLALMHHGLNVVGANSLWDAYRDFALILHQHSLSSSPSTSEYLRRVDSLYQRQLRIPLMCMQQTLEAYKDFRTGIGATLYPGDDSAVDVPNECIESFEEALGQLELLLPFEDKIEEITGRTDQTQALSVWSTYLDWITTYSPDLPDNTGKRKASGSGKSFSPNHICCLFERAVTALCLHPSVWLRFANYLEDHLSADKQRALHVLARAVRNCPWSVDLWLRYALMSEFWILDELSRDAANGLGDHLERNAEYTAFEKVDAVFEAALSAGLNQQPDLLKLWLAYADYQLRRLLRLEPRSSEWVSMLDALRSTFERADESMQHLFSHQGDPDGLLGQYYAFVEAKYVGDMSRARSIWTRLLQQPGRGSQSRFWLSYLLFERNWGDCKHFYRIARMALNSIISDSTDSSFDVILRLASESGMTVTQYRELAARVRSRRADLDKRSTSKEDLCANQTKTLEPCQTCPSQKNRKRKAPAVNSEAPVSKLPKSDLDELESMESNLKESQVQSTSLKQHGEFVEHDPSKDDRTVFVSNLDYATTEEEISKTFENCGSISSVRLVRDYAGRSKGFAFVEFETPESAQLALQKDRQPVGDGGAPNHFGRPMFVSVCDPTRTKTPAFRYTAGKQEPEKLFVRHLHKQITKVELEQLFGQYGTVISVRLATYRNGAPKGHAYVEFQNAEQASRALIATDGLLLGNKNIAVAISNPPIRQPTTSGVRKTGIQRENVDQGPPAAIEFKTPVAPIERARTTRTHARTQLSFLPRAISRHTTSDSNGGPSDVRGSTTSDIQPKTNDDFRNMFLARR